MLKEEEDDEVDETDPDITELKDSDLETEVR